MQSEALRAHAHQLLEVESNPSRHEWHALVRALLARIDALEHPTVEFLINELRDATSDPRIARQDHL